MPFSPISLQPTFPERLMTLPPLPAQLTDHYAALISREVNWGDMDAAHHVNNTVYISWAESARLALWMAAEIPIDPAIGPVLSHVSAKYIFPVRFPDMVWMGSRVMTVTEDRFTIETLIVSEKHQRVAALVSSTGLMFDYQKQTKLPLPPGLSEKMEQGVRQFLGKALPRPW